MRASEKTRRLTGLALLTAIVAVLQVVATFIKFGPFPITLALAPIIIGAALLRAPTWAACSALWCCWPVSWAGTRAEAFCGMPTHSLPLSSVWARAFWPACVPAQCTALCPESRSWVLSLPALSARW